MDAFLVKKSGATLDHYQGTETINNRSVSVTQSIVHDVNELITDPLEPGFVERLDAGGNWEKALVVRLDERVASHALALQEESDEVLPEGVAATPQTVALALQEVSEGLDESDDDGEAEGSGEEPDEVYDPGANTQESVITYLESLNSADEVEAVKTQEREGKGRQQILAFQYRD